MKWYKGHLSKISDRQSGKQQCLINLLDFEIVLQYAAPAPDIHFYARRFSLEPSHSELPEHLPKKLKNDPRIIPILQAASKKAREHRKGPDEAAGAQGGQLTLSKGSQNSTPVSQSSSPNGLSQADFASQVPMIRHPTAPKKDTSAERDRRLQGHQLLSHLERRSSGIPRGCTTPISRVEQQDVPNIGSDQGDAQCQGNRRGSWQFHSQTPANGEMSASAVQQDIRLNSASGSGIHGIKDRAVESFNRINHNIEENAPQVEVTANRTELNNMNSATDRPGLDPWIGMTKIKTRDIKIPGDQQHLLESNRRCWIPPAPGMDMPRGHVPPSLLESWNQIALRRTRPSPRDKPGQAATGAPPVVEASPPRDALPPSQSDSDDESQIPWSPSPEKRNSRNELPADSSPIRKPPNHREFEGDTTWGRPQHEQSQQNEARRSINNKDNRLDSQTEADGVIAGTSRRQLENNDTGVVEVEKSTTQDVGNQSGNDDGDSSDSDGDPPMDTSIPCALGPSSQLAQFPSQSEQEATSSGPSLSLLSGRGQIQVLETPAANISRLHVELAENGTKDNDEWRGVSQQQSPQVTKSSSQPRVFNTYDSLGNEVKSQPSQEMSHPSQEVSSGSLGVGSGPNIDVMGTQVNSGHWSSQRTPHSQSALVLNSSERGRRQRSTSFSATAFQPLRSELFADYREAPLPQSDRDSHEPDSPSSSKEIHLNTSGDNPQAATLKRAASQVDNTILSPSKRHKSTCNQNEESRSMKLETPQSIAASRRQNYINRSPRRTDALRIHEKFRSDYPSYSGDFGHFTQLCSKLRIHRAEGKLKRSFLWDDFIIMHLQRYFAYLEECAAAETKALKYEDYFTSSFSAPCYKKRSLTASAVDLCAQQSISTREPSRTARSSVIRGEPNASFTPTLVNKLSNFHAHSVGPSPLSTHPGVNFDRQFSPVPSPTPSKRRDGLPALPSSIGPASIVPTPTSTKNINTSAPERDDDRNSAAVLAESPSKSVTSVPGRCINVDRTSSAVPNPSPNDPASATVPERGTDVNRNLIAAPVKIPNRAANISVPEPSADDTNVPPAAPSLASNAHSHASVANPNTVPIENSVHSSIETVWPEPKREQAPGSDASDGESDHGEGTDIKMETLETHETESLELGDEPPAPVVRVPTLSPPSPGTAPTSYEIPETDPESEVEPAEPTQPESMNENWFVSLRHLRPTGSGVWADDPNTPFKTWARLDQNLLCERRRRGGRYRVVDEHGVIQRRLTNRRQ